ncbi:MAG: hypothetical protein ACOC3Y_03365 [Desulfohalobiaceae bacterium]
MANPVDLSVIISQLPRVQKMQEDAQRLPQLLQDQLSREVIEKQKRVQHEVQQVEKTELSYAVSKDKQHSGQQERQRQGSQQEKEQGKTEEQHQDDAGKLINLRV